MSVTLTACQTADQIAPPAKLALSDGDAGRFVPPVGKKPAADLQAALAGGDGYLAFAIYWANPTMIQRLLGTGNYVVAFRHVDTAWHATAETPVVIRCGGDPFETGCITKEYQFKRVPAGIYVLEAADFPATELYVAGVFIRSPAKGTDLLQYVQNAAHTSIFSSAPKVIPDPSIDVRRLGVPIWIVLPNTVTYAGDLAIDTEARASRFLSDPASFRLAVAAHPELPTAIDDQSMGPTNHPPLPF